MNQKYKNLIAIIWGTLTTFVLLSNVGTNSHRKLKALPGNELVKQEYRLTCSLEELMQERGKYLDYSKYSEDEKEVYPFKEDIEKLRALDRLIESKKQQITNIKDSPEYRRYVSEADREILGDTLITIIPFSGASLYILYSSLRKNPQNSKQSFKNPFLT